MRRPLELTEDRLVANEARLLQSPSTTNLYSAEFINFYRKLFIKHGLDSGRSECFSFFEACDFYLFPVVCDLLPIDCAIHFDFLLCFFSHLPNRTPKNPGHPILAVSTRAASSFPPVPAVVPTLNPARRRDAKEQTGDLSANRAAFQVLVGASIPDAVGVSSEKSMLDVIPSG
ncbi:hypothetical protein [Burkholderia pyrrocinia]|uniref:hypothetical protein n=1 Tax=Burkholderia pyrrocinia TaxID=60550 RepID=UPI002AB130D7|nr:hypothetical protein [Burkholderia pyrrocinia]